MGVGLVTVALTVGGKPNMAVDASVPASTIRAGLPPV
jgi:hypothetical protein